MKKYLFIYVIVFSIGFFNAISFGNNPTDNINQNLHLKGVIESLDLESAKITMQGHTYSLDEKIKIYDSENILLNRSMLKEGQLISYKLIEPEFNNTEQDSNNTITTIVIQSKILKQDRLQ